MIELNYALNTLFFVISGAMVMWMAAGFTALEAGSVRTKNVTEILTKNVALFSVSSIAFLFAGYGNILCMQISFFKWYLLLLQCL